MTEQDKSELIAQLANETRPRPLLDSVAQLQKAVSQGNFSVDEAAAPTFSALLKLHDICSDDPTFLREAIVKGAIPASLWTSTTFEVRVTLLSTREYLGKWLAELPTSWFVSIAEECLATLAPELAGEAFEPACWAISDIGYRTPRIVVALEALVDSASRDRRLAAIGALATLGAIAEKRQRYFDIALRDAPSSLRPGAVSILSDLADSSSLVPLEGKFLHGNERISEDLAESLTTIIGRIAARTEDPQIHDRLLELLLRIHALSEKGIYPALLSRGDVLPHIDTVRVIAYLVGVIAGFPEIKAKMPGALRLALLRLSDCWLPQHLLGCERIESTDAVGLLRECLLTNEGYSGRSATPLSDLKSHSVTALLRLGRRELLASFSDVIESEESPFTAFQFIETMSIFQFGALPPKIRKFITEKINLGKGQDAELILRLSAFRLARSAASQDAFDALINPGLLFAGSVMRDTVEALADVCLTRAANPSDRPAIVARLLELLRHDVEQPQISTITRALNVLALAGFLSADHIPRLMAFLLGAPGQLDSFHAGQIVHALGGFPPESLPVELQDKLKEWARGEENWLAWRSIEALINLGYFEANSSWLASRIGLTSDSGSWRWRANPAVSKWSSAYVVLLFGKYGDAFAQAVADVLLDRNWEASERAAMTLAGVYQNRQLGESPLIAAALIERVRTRNRPNASDLSVFDYLHTIAPSTLALTDWSQMQANWTSSARAALADALGRLEDAALAEKIAPRLLNLARDSHFGVRRASIRALANVSPKTLREFNEKLANSSEINERVRATEMLPYLTQTDAAALQALLGDDQVKRVREAVRDAKVVRQKALLARTYLAKVLAIKDPTDDEMLLLVKYVQSLAEVGDDATLNEVTHDLKSNSMPSRVRHLKAWLHKELGQEWEKRRQKWPEPLSQIRGNITIGNGSLSVDGREVPARYEIWLRSSEQASDQFRWGGEVFVPKTNDIQRLMNTTHTLTLEDGSHGEVWIGGISITTASDRAMLTFSGQDAFPQKL